MWVLRVQTKFEDYVAPRSNFPKKLSQYKQTKTEPMPNPQGSADAKSELLRLLPKNWMFPT